MNSLKPPKTGLYGRLRGKYFASRIQPIVRETPSVFLSACKALNISVVEADYLGKYKLALDVFGKSIAQNVLRTGSFQIELFELLKEHYPDRDLTFIDVGANIGTTCLNAHYFGFRDFIAFEPVKANFTLLSRNLKQLEGDSSVKLHQRAVGSRAGSVKINLNRESTGRHSIVREFDGSREEVEVVRLDDILPANRGFLWIDTEGYEVEVVKGGLNYISSLADGICVEVTPGIIGRDGVKELSDLLSPRFGRFFTGDGRRFHRLDIIDELSRGHQCDVICLK